MRDYFKMLSFAGKQLPLFIIAVLFMLISAALECAQIGALIPLFDKIFNDQQIILPSGVPDFLVHIAELINRFDRHVLYRFTIILIPVLFFLRAVSFYFKGFFMDMIAQKTVMDVKNRLYRKYQALSLDFYSKKRQGELMSRITNDVSALGHSISYGIADTFYESVHSVGLITLAAMLNWAMFSKVMIIFPIMAYIVYFIGKQLKRFTKSTQATAADLNTLLSETIQGVRIIKGFSREDHEIKRCEEINKRFYKLSLKSIRRNKLISPITEYLGVLAVVVLLLVCGGDVFEKRISFGVFAAFIGAFLAVMRPVKKVANAHGENMKGIAASERIYEILDITASVKDKEDAIDMPMPRKQIEFTDVSFAYDEEDGLVLKNISHAFPVGQTTAIVGPTGCGKSTILNLISRFYDPTEGVILIDGIDLRNMSSKSLRSHIGIVTQDMILFHESIRDNLKYGKLDATDDEIIEACRKALAWDFVEKLPQGLDTVVGDRGFRLSGGQKQRLCIARAILKDPHILLLDEATSALDAESEQLVQKALDNLMEKRTVLVVAHRLSTIRHASCILVMKDGQVLERGTHEELIKTSPLYEKLARLNFNM